MKKEHGWKGRPTTSMGEDKTNPDHVLSVVSNSLLKVTNLFQDVFSYFSKNQQMKEKPADKKMNHTGKG